MHFRAGSLVPWWKSNWPRAGAGGSPPKKRREGRAPFGTTHKETPPSGEATAQRPRRSPPDGIPAAAGAFTLASGLRSERSSPPRQAPAGPDAKSSSRRRTRESAPRPRTAPGDHPLLRGREGRRSGAPLGNAAGIGAARTPGGPFWAPAGPPLECALRYAGGRARPPLAQLDSDYSRAVVPRPQGVRARAHRQRHR